MFQSTPNSRILQMFKSYAKGEIFVHDNCKLAVHMQISEFRPLKTDNTDGLLDLLTYAPRVLAEFEEFVISQSILVAQEYEAMDVPECNTNF